MPDVNKTKQEKLPTSANPIGRLSPAPIVEEVKQSYLEYAMSVIIQRALPDVRDGLKPVHRRILYAMGDLGLRHTARFRKSAHVVGEVMAKYHPHGDAAIYDSMVRMAQDFAMRAPLVNGQGNFGCFTNDTKVKLTDGRSLSFAELIKEHREGKKNFTYAINGSGLISIAEIKNPRLTRARTDLIKVILDNKTEIRCTPNHLFMLRNGSYQEAQNLTPGTSLMPLYEKISKNSDRLRRAGYVLILQNKTGEWIPAHHLADNFNLNREKYRPTDGRVRHHLDFNKLNNNPDNIKRMRWEEHWKIQETTKNHRVTKISFLKEKENVYDLTIDNFHNFCLDAGVFVHNSMDGDSAAAMRYTEARLTALAEEMLFDIEKDTVGFIPTYDGSHTEPTVLPTKVPNLLLNGTVGIAVGMATNIAPHNLGEICDGVTKLIDHPKTTVEELCEIVQGPDFPTGGIIYNKKDIAAAYATGRGGLVIRAKAEITENKNGQFQILVSEMPYQVNKAELIEKIANLVQEKKIEGIKDLRDESNKDGVRVVIELKKDSYPKKVLNQLFNLTDLQTTFHFNMLALVDGLQPRVLHLKNILEEFIKHRQVVIRRRTAFDLAKAKERAHILEGLTMALDKIDLVIKTIKASRDKDEAKVELMKKFKFSERQAVAILEMRLQQLANLERQKIEDELKEKKALIKELESILASDQRILSIIKTETAELKANFNTPRKTQIVAHGVKEFTTEDLIPNEPTIVMTTSDGYIKRVPTDTFRTQSRGGKGVIGVTTKEDESVDQLLTMNTHDNILFFTNRGRVFQLMAYDVPQGSRTAKGQALVNFLQLAPNEKISALLPVEDIAANKYLVMVTTKGTIKKTSLADFANVRRSGIIALKLKADDNLEWVKPSTGENEIILATKGGQAIRFREKDVREMGRAAGGVRGMKLKGTDEIIGMDIIDTKTKQLEFLVVGANGTGKCTSLNEYKCQGRGGSGIKTAEVTAKTGPLVYARVVDRANINEHDLVMMSTKGQAIRLPFNSINTSGRATQGVRLMRFKEEGDQVASVTIL